MSENSEQSIVRMPIRQSLTEPVMIAGAERELVLLLAFASLMIWICGKDFLSLVIAFSVWFVGIFFGRLMAKVDSRMIKKTILHLKLQDYYPANEPITKE